MSRKINNISANSIVTIFPETRAWVKQISNPHQVIEELVAKISVLEEELAISQEQVQTLKDELSAEQSKVQSYQEELAACHQEMEALNIELHSYNKAEAFQRHGVKLHSSYIA